MPPGGKISDLERSEEDMRGLPHKGSHQQTKKTAKGQEWCCQKSIPYMGIFIFFIIFPDFPGPHSDSKSLPRGPPTLPRTPPSSRATIPQTESFRLTHAMHTPMPLGHPDPHRSLPLHD